MTQTLNAEARLQGEHVYVYPGSQIDANVVIDGFTQLWNGLVIKSGVRIGSGVIFLKNENNTTNACIAENAIIGAGCIVGADVTIAQGAILEPGSVVLQNVPAHAIVGGNPARITGYTQTNDLGKDINLIAGTNEDVVSIGVNNVTLHRFKLVKDYRGDLSVGEFTKEIPDRKSVV